ncbi:MAG TPA: cell division protein FtsL [Candidatus Competibacteraceae bacterium]|nr:cell division protein FtsL [Candidatus Competibacteraceae bacterium]
MTLTKIIGLIVCALLATGLGLVHSKHQSRKLFQELQTLQVRRDDLEIEWTQLQLEQSTLATESVVDQAARTRLNMVIPDPATVVYITR